MEHVIGIYGLRDRTLVATKEKERNERRGDEKVTVTWKRVKHIEDDKNTREQNDQEDTREGMIIS